MGNSDGAKYFYPRNPAEQLPPGAVHILIVTIRQKRGKIYDWLY
jgi:hypothetical protein